MRPTADAGGKAGTVPIVAAGGEYVVPRAMVARIGGGDVALGHAVLDRIVRAVRRETAETLRKLPGPKR